MPGEGKEFQIEPINKLCLVRRFRSAARSVLEARDQFGLREDVAFDGLLYFGGGGLWFQACRVIERVELEKIVVCRASPLRTRAAITDFAGVVLALARAVGKSWLRRHAFRQATGRGRKVVDQPVDRGFLWRVGIVHHQRKTLRAGGRFVPCEGRGNIRAVTSISSGQRAIGLERWAGQLQFRFRLFLRGCLRDGRASVERRPCVQSNQQECAAKYQYPVISNDILHGWPLKMLRAAGAQVKNTESVRRDACRFQLTEFHG